MWNQLSIRKRCRLIASAAASICDRSEDLIAACQSGQRTDPVETISGELLPLCAALKYLGKRGAKILAPRRVALSNRPLWMFGVRAEVRRVPLGTVLVIGTWNYPLLLPGVQIAHALAAGNRVKLKPSVGTERASEILVRCFYDAGVPADQLTLLDSSTEAASEAIAEGMDLVVLTGSAATGKKVLQSAAPTLSATIMELSGSDAVIVLPGHDLDRLADALYFGLRFNGSATCIGPRRLLIRRSDHMPVIQRIRQEFENEPPVIVHSAARQSVADQITAAIESGATDLLGRFCEDRLRKTGELHPIVLDQVRASDPIASADLFAPVLSIILVDDDQTAIKLVNDCPYRLAASIFGPTAAAARVADQLQVGSVTINDMIAPTADPRVPFGGRGDSGFGVTRGPEGLLAMTAAKVVSTRRSRFAPHLRRRTDSDQEMLSGLLELSHGRGLSNKLSGLRRLVLSVKKE